MIHVLVVTPDAASVAALAGRRRGVELLHARDAEEAVEKLGRNRRVDAVLLLCEGGGNAEVALAIREDILSPPPSFEPRGEPQAPGVRPLDATDLPGLLDLVEIALDGA